MNYVDFDFIKKVASKHQLKCWKIYDSAGELIDKNESDTVKLEESTEALRDVFSVVVGDFVTIVLSPRKLTKGGDQITNVFKYRVKCEKQIESIAAPVIPGKTGAANFSDSITAQLIQLNVALAKTQAQQEINDLQRQLNEIKNEKKNGKGRVLEKYLEALLMQAAKPAPAAIAEVKETDSIKPIAGTNEAGPENRPTAPAVKQLTQTLARLKNVDSNFVISLGKLADFAEANPELYKQYLSNL